jgi:hypothetical protein
MRNNPFAPDVPCHRVLANNRSLGVFGGSWGKKGENEGKKIKLLREEGVKFGSNGKVRWPVFKDFQGSEDENGCSVPVVLYTPAKSLRRRSRCVTTKPQMKIQTLRTKKLQSWRMVQCRILC